MPESMRSNGMRDILPADMERFRRIEHAFRDVCLGWGYEEVRTPTIEHLYLESGALTPATDSAGQALTPGTSHDTAQKDTYERT